MNGSFSECYAEAQQIPRRVRRSRSADYDLSSRRATGQASKIGASRLLKKDHVWP